jgi:two-component system response regulator MprA
VQPIQSERVSERAISARRRILIVEDAEPTRRRIADVLRTHGYDVAEASDGLKALKAVSTERFDAILLDLVMPNVDGWQFRETQLRHPELAAIPTVIVTVHPLQEPERYALRAQNVVRKPFEDAELVAMLDRVCAVEEPSREADESAVDGPAASQLFWSRRGEIACSEHAPEMQSKRWGDEQWAPIPTNQGYHQIVYQCQYCPGHDGPIQRRSRNSGS